MLRSFVRYVWWSVYPAGEWLTEHIPTADFYLFISQHLNQILRLPGLYSILYRHAETFSGRCLEKPLKDLLKVDQNFFTGTLWFLEGKPKGTSSGSGPVGHTYWLPPLLSSFHLTVRTATEDMFLHESGFPHLKNLHIATVVCCSIRTSSIHMNVWKARFLSFRNAPQLPRLPGRVLVPVQAQPPAQLQLGALLWGVGAGPEPLAGGPRSHRQHGQLHQRRRGPGSGLQGTGGGDVHKSAGRHLGHGAAAEQGRGKAADGFHTVEQKLL